MVRSAITRVIIVSLMTLWSAAAYGASPRVALVIGNSVYSHGGILDNPVNDAVEVAASLERLGFAVQRINNAGFDAMRRRLLQFGQQARESQFAIVYFAGHGIEIGGENWLIPTDAGLKTDLTLEQEAIGLKGVMQTVSAASTLGLVILDACRDNPFSAKMKRSTRTRSVSRGFARVEPSSSVLVVYAAKDGTTANDGNGRHSPFTEALLRHLETPGLEINFLFRNVRDDVIIATGREQEPFVYGSLARAAIYLKPGVESFAAPQTPPDEVAWRLVRDTKDAELLRRFASTYPGSPWRSEAERIAAALEAASKTTSRPAAPPRGSSKCFTFEGRQFCQ